MRPIKFKESNVVFAKDQKEYLPLPAWRDSDGTVISCWGLSFKERIKLLFSGRVWLRLLTYNKPLQPQRLDVDYPFTK